MQGGIRDRGRDITCKGSDRVCMCVNIYINNLTCGTHRVGYSALPLSRHPASPTLVRFRHGGLGALAAELSLDVRRMWLRNCGRDDRLVADRGREARHPFLDEGVMELLLGLPLHCIADLRQAPGLGDKRVLRQALVKLGLPEAACRVKRAIQFGSRIGKLSNRREFGSNRAANK